LRLGVEIQHRDLRLVEVHAVLAGKDREQYRSTVWEEVGPGMTAFACVSVSQPL
jgi:hypothetical protein